MLAIEDTLLDSAVTGRLCAHATTDAPFSSADFVLAVDDEPAILGALTRLLRPDGIAVLTATCGDEALELLERQAASVGVIVSDYAMPGMNGAELLRAARLRWPDIARILLTGNADLPAASRAVNEGQLSRLYTKPWQPDEFRKAIADALEQHHVISENRRLRIIADEQAVRLERWNRRLEATVAERTQALEAANDGLHKAFVGTVQLLVGFLERRLPERATRCREVARFAARLAQRAGLSEEQVRWVQVAALIHDIGLGALPDLLLRRQPADLLPAARARYEQHPLIGQQMLGRVEELAELGTWVRHHHERWDGRGYPDRLAEQRIPLPSRIISLADGYLEARDCEGGTASRWRRRQLGLGAYDPGLLELLNHELSGIAASPVAQAHEGVVAIAGLRAGMLLADSIRTASGAVLVPGGQALTHDVIDRIRQLSATGALVDSVSVVQSPAAIETSHV